MKSIQRSLIGTVFAACYSYGGSLFSIVSWQHFQSFGIAVKSSCVGFTLSRVTLRDLGQVIHTHVTLSQSSIHRVPQKRPHFYFSNNFVKNQPILMIFGV